MPDTGYSVATAARLRIETAKHNILHTSTSRPSTRSESNYSTDASTSSDTSSSDVSLTSLLAAFPSTPSSDDKKKGNERRDIYFSPFDVDAEDKESDLSSPLRTPPQVDFDWRGALDEGSWFGRQHRRGGRRFSLTNEQHDHLVQALVEAPMVREQVCRTMNPERDAETFNPRRASVADDDTGVEVATRAAIGQMSESPTVSRRIHEMERQFAESFPHHANTSRLPRAELRGMGILDPGGGVRYCSEDFGLTAQCQNLSCYDVALKGPDECSFRIERTEGESAHVIFQIREQIVRRNNGTKANVFAVEIDVTEHFSKAALMELLEVFISSSSVGRHISEDELISRTKAAMPILTPKTCTMQTLTLLSTLHTIRNQYRYFFLLRPTAFHNGDSGGVPSRISIPYMSQHLWLCLSARKREFMQKVMADVVGHKAKEGKAFTVEVAWPGHEMRVRGVRLVRQDGDGEGKGAIWVCFARDVLETDIWNMREG